MSSHLPLCDSQTPFLHDLHLQPCLLDLIAVLPAHSHPITLLSFEPAKPFYHQGLALVCFAKKDLTTHFIQVSIEIPERLS